MTGSSLESALKTLYKDKVCVRRNSWDDGIYVRPNDFRYNAPVYVDGGPERLFVPTIKDFLTMDWERVDGEPLPDRDDSNGIYRAVMYMFVTFKPARILGWYPDTRVYIDGSKIKMVFISDGAELTCDYIPAREDYLSNEWVPYVGTEK